VAPRKRIQTFEKSLIHDFKQCWSNRRNFDWFAYKVCNSLQFTDTRSYWGLARRNCKIADRTDRIGLKAVYYNLDEDKVDDDPVTK
jgi:hypothetical protein